MVGSIRDAGSYACIRIPLDRRFVCRTVGECSNAEIHLSLLTWLPQRPGQPAAPAQITIRHDSSRQGMVADNDFATYFNGQGTFRRL